MSKPEIDPKDLDDTSMFDFLGEEVTGAANGTRAIEPVSVHTPVRGKIRMPQIREPVPVSISGPLSAGTSAVANAAGNQTKADFPQADGDFDFLNDVDFKPARTNTGRDVGHDIGRDDEFDSFSQFDHDKRDLSFAEDMRKVHQVDAEPEDLPALIRYGLLTLSILVLGGIGYLAHTYLLTPPTPAIVEGKENSIVEPQSATVTEVARSIPAEGSTIEAVGDPVNDLIVDDTDAIADTGNGQSLYDEFKNELATLEAMVANGDFDATTDRIEAMDRTLFGYGEPEFVELQTRIEFLRRDNNAENNFAIKEVERLTAQASAEAKAEAERAAAAEQAAKLELDRLAAIQAAQAEADKLAAEQAAQDEARRVAAEQAALAEAQRIATVKAAEEEAIREASRTAAREAAEQLAAAEAARAEAAKAEAARVEAANRALEQAARDDAQRLAAVQAANAERSAQVEAERRDAEIAARRIAERDAAARLAVERLNAERETARKATEDAAKIEAERVAAAELQATEEARRLKEIEATRAAARRAARQRAERLAAQQRASEIEAADAAATSAAIRQQSIQVARADVEEPVKPRPTELSVQPRPITDDELQQVYRQFNNLETAIEDRDITRVINLTKPSGARVQQFLQIFENSQSLNAQIVNVSTRNNSSTISGTLKILNITRTDGSVVQPPSSLSNIALTSSRTGSQWSVIEW